MPSINLSTILLAWGVLAPLVTYGWQKADAHFETRHAVAKARLAEQEQCAARVGAVTREINDAAQKRIAGAMDAAGKVVRAPADAGALERLCKSDGAACRGAGER